MSNIDWSQLITKQKKDEAASALRFAETKVVLAQKNAGAVSQIARIQDRIDTLGYGIEVGEATPEEEAEQVALAAPLKAWKLYKYALGKVTAQAGWFESPVWPVEPATPEIAATPTVSSADKI
ncbi:phage tail protein [Pseudomonas sp. SWRI102]|uniref:Phage tail protein n=1 Tax=Pseudomonas marvdashtae TaxID=2745500 RepID=A0A923FNK0_9PSED|nr:phage tail protein [Pseudomonas marvdashtae]MBV4552260.1 phage tail protein [Pseudomonas marvdashtae]